jgi:hypothetical protein
MSAVIAAIQFSTEIIFFRKLIKFNKGLFSMRWSAFLLLSFFLIQVSNAQDITSDQLQETAECLVAVGMFEVSAQLTGNYKDERIFRKATSKLRDKYYSDLESYANGQILIYEQFSQLPNEMLVKYSKMDDRTQLKYADQVNKCYESIGYR